MMNSLDDNASITNEAITELSANNTGDFVRELSAILEQEIGCYNDLLDTARSEQKAIVHGKLNELKLAVEAEENLIASSRALDDIRQRIVEVIAGQFGCSSENLTLKEIISRVDPAYREQLNRLRDDLKKVTGDLAFVNRANAQLIKSSIEFINQTMWILLQSGKKSDNTYDDQGKGRKPMKRKVLVDRLT